MLNRPLIEKLSLQKLQTLFDEIDKYNKNIDEFRESYLVPALERKDDGACMAYALISSNMYKQIQDIEANIKNFLNVDKLPRIVEQTSLKLIAKKFDDWMKKYQDSHRKKGDYDDNNKALLNYLDDDLGFRYINSYERFCELADEVKQLGYQTSNPPCSYEEFAREVYNADDDSFGDNSKPEIPSDLVTKFKEERNSKENEFYKEIADILLKSLKEAEKKKEQTKHHQFFKAKSQYKTYDDEANISSLEMARSAFGLGHKKS